MIDDYNSFWWTKALVLNDVLCVKLLYVDRSKNLSYIFRHAEAAGIMIMLANEQYAGHAEHAWVTIQKITLGVMFTTQHVRAQLRRSAGLT